MKEGSVADLRGRMASRMAFSWTCHPNMKEPRAQSSRQRRKPRAPRGRSHRDATAGFRDTTGSGNIWKIHLDQQRPTNTTNPLLHLSLLLYKDEARRCHKREVSLCSSARRVDVTHQDGQHSANEGDGGRDGGQDHVLELLNQAARHGGLRKICLLQQLQLHT